MMDYVEFCTAVSLPQGKMFSSPNLQMLKIGDRFSETKIHVLFPMLSRRYRELALMKSSIYP
jgi:hypothetical protein